MNRPLALRWLWRALLGFGMALAFCMMPWPTGWPSVVFDELCAALQILLGLWGGPPAALGLALGYFGYGLTEPAGSQSIQLVPLLAPAARALTAWILTPLATMDPRLPTPTDWRRWLLGSVLAANLVGAAVAQLPTLATGGELSSAFRTALPALASAVAGTWILGTLLLRCLWPVFGHEHSYHRPEPVDLQAIIGVHPPRDRGPSA